MPPKKKASFELSPEIATQIADEVAKLLSNSSDDEGYESDSRAVVMLSGEIGEHHRSLINTLLEFHFNPNFNDPITLLINSDGGDASVGWAIIDVMNFIRLPVHTVSLGYVCSMAADIFVNGDVRTIGEHSTLMIHPHTSGTVGNFHTLIASQRGDIIEHTRRVNHYLSNSKYKTEEAVNVNLLGVSGGDLYLTPEEVIEHGLADEIARTSENKRNKRHNLLPSGSKTNSSKSKARKAPAKSSGTRSKSRKK
jgi:ATP-dependent Clp protease, protease subunit